MQNPFTTHAFYWACTLLATCGPGQAQAQSAAPAAKEAGSLSFTLPQLPEGGGEAGLVRAIQLRVVYPRQALRDAIQGQSLVSFIVAPDGTVRHVRMVRSIRPDLDTAVVQAVQKLPQLVPATQFGKPVACSMQAPVTFLFEELLKIGKNPVPAADSAQLYTAVRQLPIYRGRLGTNQLAADLAAEYLRLSGKDGCFIPAINLGVLLTVGPSGSLYDVQIAKSDEQKAALEAYGDAVAQQEEPSLPAACREILAQAAQHLPRLLPAYADGKRVATRLQVTLKSAH